MILHHSRRTTAEKRRVFCTGTSWLPRICTSPYECCSNRFLWGCRKARTVVVSNRASGSTESKVKVKTIVRLSMESTHRDIQNVKIWQDSEVGHFGEPIVGNVEDLEWSFQWFIQLLDFLKALILEVIVADVKVSQQRKIENVWWNLLQRIAWEVQSLQINKLRECVVFDVINYVFEHIKESQIGQRCERLSCQLSNSVLWYVENLRSERDFYDSEEKTKRYKSKLMFRPIEIN